MSKAYYTKNHDERRARLTGQYEQFVEQYARTADFVENLQHAINEKLTPSPGSKSIPLTEEYRNRLENALGLLRSFSRKLDGEISTLLKIRAALVSDKIKTVRREINILRERLVTLSKNTFTSLKTLKLKIKRVYDTRVHRLDPKRGSKFLKGMMYLFFATSVVVSPLKQVEKSDLYRFLDSPSAEILKSPGGSGTGPDPIGGAIGPPPVADHNPFGDLLDLFKNLQKLGEGVAKDLLKEGSEHETLYVNMVDTRQGEAIREILRKFQPQRSPQSQSEFSDE